MVRPALYVQSLAALGASASPLAASDSRGQASSNDTVTLVVTAPNSGTVTLTEFDGTDFKIVTNNTISGTIPSWTLLREGSSDLYAVDEGAPTIRLFDLDQSAESVSLVQNFSASSGVVFLSFNSDKTRMAGAAYESGHFDFWDSSATDGSLELLTQFASPGPTGPNPNQDGPHPHQVQLDPTGAYFVGNDLGTDSILVFDAKTFNMTNKYHVNGSGIGPRHAVFYPPNVAKPTHYFLVCELANVILVHTIDYTAEKGIEFTQIQSISTYGAAFPPADPSTAAAGEIHISVDGKHVYASNRLSGNETDSIAHFLVEPAESPADLRLQFSDTATSGGLIPRMFSLGLTGTPYDDLLFIANQNGNSGQAGLIALQVNLTDGTLGKAPVATLGIEQFGPAGANLGPQFVQQI